MVARPATAPQTPNAAPRRLAGNVTVRIASVCGVSIAPPMPWIARAAMSMAGVWANPQAADATTNTVRPIRKSRFAPTMSPSRPPVISSDAYAMVYALTIHSTWSSEACRLTVSAGTAMFTIVVSSRIMKKPRQRIASTSQGRRLPSVVSAAVSVL